MLTKNREDMLWNIQKMLNNVDDATIHEVECLLKKEDDGIIEVPDKILLSKASEKIQALEKEIEIIRQSNDSLIQEIKRLNSPDIQKEFKQELKEKAMEVKREELYTALKKQVKEALERNKILSKTNSHLVYQLTEKYRSDSNQ